VPPTEILDCPVKPGNDPGKVDLKEKCSGRILSIEFPENRENNREFVIFFDLFDDFLTLSNVLISMSCTRVPCKLKQGIFFVRTGN